MKANLTEGTIQIFKLKDNNGNETTNRRRVLEITQQFYEELYTSQIERIENELSLIIYNKVLSQGSEDRQI